MFGGFSSWIESASDALQDLSQHGAELVRRTGILDLDERYNDPDSAGPTTNAASAADEVAPETATGITSLLVTEPPSHWRSSHSEWTLLVTSALADANLCAIGPAHIPQVERDTLFAIIEATLSAQGGAAAVVPAVDSSFEPTADLLEWFQQQETLMTAYSAVVPEFASEEGFWNTFGWKLTVFRLCETPEALLTISKASATSESLANAEEEEDVEASSSDVEVTKTLPNGNSQENEYWMQVESAWQQLHAKEEHAASQAATVVTELEAADGNLKLLVSLIAKKDVSSDLAQSVVESCEYHKVKLTRLMASVVDEQNELRNTLLDMHTGDLYARLMKANHDLKLALAQADAMGRGESVEAVITTGAMAPDTSTSKPVRDTTTAETAEAIPTPPSPVRRSSSPTSPAQSPSSQPPAASVPSVDEVTHADAEIELTNEPPQDSPDQASHTPLNDVSFEVALPWDDD